MRESAASLPMGVVVRRTPGVTRWARWCWTAAGVLPGAGPADWRELRRDGDAVEYHASTVTLHLWRTDTEAYLTAISTKPPCVYVILRDRVDTGSGHDVEVAAVTASPFEAQDHCDIEGDIVERVPMPEGLVAFIRDFCAEHHVERPFVKRRRDPATADAGQDGVGDARIRQTTDVYRPPRRRRLH